MTETKEAETAQIETAIQDANFEKAVEEERTKKCCMFCDSEINVLPICENCLMNESVDLDDNDFYDFGESEETPYDENIEVRKNEKL